MSRFVHFVGIGIAAGMVLAGASCIRIPAAPPVSARQLQVARSSLVVPGDVKAAVRDPDVLVWLIADNIHSGMVFPYDWLLESGFVPPSGFGHPEFVTFSWGDRAAYVQQKWLGAGQVFRALFTPSPAVMEIISVDWDVVCVCQQQRIWRKLVPRGQGPRVAAFLNHVSRTGADGRPIAIGPSSWGDGFLLESNYSYYFPRVCNIWTAQAVEACGCEINPWLAMTADGLIRQAESPRNGFELVWLGDGKTTQE